MTKKILCILLLIATWCSGIYCGFLLGVEYEQNFLAHRSVKMGNCVAVFE